MSGFFSNNMAQNQCMFLNQISKKGVVKIIGFSQNISLKIKRRLLELGFVKDTIITLTEKSFLNEVLLVELNGYCLSLRSDIAKHIIVEKILMENNYAK